MDFLKQHVQRALSGFHPPYYSDLFVLGHDGWEPGWQIVWYRSEAGTGTWRAGEALITGWRKGEAIQWP